MAPELQSYGLWYQFECMDVVIVIALGRVIAEHCRTRTELTEKRVPSLGASLASIVVQLCFKCREARL